MFIESHYLNKELISQFNSTLGKYIGFSEYGERNAKFWNNNPDILQGMRTVVNGFCKHNAQLLYMTQLSVIKQVSAQPGITITNQLQYNVIVFFKSAVSFQFTHIQYYLQVISIYTV